MGEGRTGITQALHPGYRGCENRRRKPMELRPAGATPSRRMSADWFTGTVWQDPIIEAPAPARLRAALVTFEAGARTPWTTPPPGPNLSSVSGLGRAEDVPGAVPEKLHGH